MTDETGSELSSRERQSSRQRLGTVFGGISGVCLALIVDFTLDSLVRGYPAGPTTFVLVAVFAMLGMTLSDRLGERAFRIMGITAGLLIALAIVVVGFGMLGPS